MRKTQTICRIGGRGSDAALISKSLLNQTKQKNFSSDRGVLSYPTEAAVSIIHSDGLMTRIKHGLGLKR